MKVEAERASGIPLVFLLGSLRTGRLSAATGQAGDRSGYRCEDACHWTAAGSRLSHAR